MSTTKPTTSRGTAVFAQRVDAPRPPMFPAEERHFSSGLALFCVPTVTCALLLVFARPNGAQDRPGAAQKPPTSAERARIAADTQSSKASASVDAASRRPLAFYTEVVRGNMFSPPQPPPPPAPRPAEHKTVKLPPVTLPEIDPFADWSYTGTIQQGDQTTALLENTKTKEGQYVHPGDNFMGARVESITDQMVTLKSGNKPHLLAKSDTITVTPLDKSAAYLTAQPTPTPGQPGMPGMPGMSPGPTPGSFTLPNGRTISADQYQRWQQRRQNRMNRQFNGGGRRGGGFGGFGGFGGG